MKKLIVLAGLMSAFAAHAGLSGSTVNVDFFFPDTSTLYCSNGSAVVGGGVEYASGCSGFSAVSIDISDAGMTVTHSLSSWSPASFNGFHLTVLSGPAITAASYLGGSMNVTSLTVDPSGLWVNFAGQGTGDANFSITAVPEPETYALMSLGLLGVAAAVRRQRRSAA